MDVSPRLFRSLLLASLLLGIAAGAVDFVFPSLVPEALTEAQSSLEKGILDTPGWGSLVLWIVVAIVLGVLSIAGLVGLFLLQSWGRHLSVLSTALAFPLILYVGPTVQSGWSLMLQEVSMVLWGGLLAVAYFSPLARQFSGAPGAVEPGAPAVASSRSALGTVALVIGSGIAGIVIFVAAGAGIFFYKVMDWSSSQEGVGPAMEEGKALPAPMDRPTRPDC